MPSRRARSYTSRVPSTPRTASAVARTQPPATPPPPRRQWREPRRRCGPAGCGTSGGSRGGRGGRDLAKPPLAPLVVEDRLKQIASRDVGPEHRRHVQLGVGELPQQEVRDAQL